MRNFGQAGLLCGAILSIEVVSQGAFQKIATLVDGALSTIEYKLVRIPRAPREISGIM